MTKYVHLLQHFGGQSLGALHEDALAPSLLDTGLDFLRHGTDVTIKASHECSSAQQEHGDIGGQTSNERVTFCSFGLEVDACVLAVR